MADRGAVLLFDADGMSVSVTEAERIAKLIMRELEREKPKQ